MWLIARILILGMLAASVLARVAAALGVLRQPKPRRVQVAHWLGLTISGELGLALPLCALAIAARAGATWRPYYFGVPVAAAAALLGYATARVHLRRLTGLKAPAPRLAGACLG